MGMFQHDLLYQFSILFELAVVLLFLFYLKLKSSLFKRIFPTCIAFPSLPFSPSAIRVYGDAAPPGRRAEEQEHERNDGGDHQKMGD